jgi:hypothetical protein
VELPLGSEGRDVCGDTLDPFFDRVGADAMARDAPGGVGGVEEERGGQPMMLIRRVGRPTPTETGEYRVWLTSQPSEPADVAS